MYVADEILKNLESNGTLTITGGSSPSGQEASGRRVGKSEALENREKRFPWGMAAVAAIGAYFLTR